VTRDFCARVISISWGWPEFQTALGLTWTAAAMDAVSTTFSEAALLGVTVFAASGDQGSECQIGDGHAHVIYPTSDPYLTSCGGTEIENVTAFGSFDEVLWNDNGASGGGVSDFFVVPSWQASAGVPASVNDHTHLGRGLEHHPGRLLQRRRHLDRHQPECRRLPRLGGVTRRRCLPHLGGAKLARSRVASCAGTAVRCAYRRQRRSNRGFTCVLAW
jgi:hypothetical protein